MTFEGAVASARVTSDGTVMLSIEVPARQKYQALRVTDLPGVIFRWQVTRSRSRTIDLEDDHGEMDDPA